MAMQNATTASQAGRFGVVLFASTHAALRAEKVLRAQGLAVKLTPTPRHLSSDCGVSLRFEHADRDAVEQVLVANGVPVEAIHRL